MSFSFRICRKCGIEDTKYLTRVTGYNLCITNKCSDQFWKYRKDEMKCLERRVIYKNGSDILNAINVDVDKWLESVQ
jgi:anaerobic ribonucleoside-triphosphate reductase